MIRKCQLLFCDNEHGTGEVTFPDVAAMGPDEFYRVFVEEKALTIRSLRQLAKENGWGPHQWRRLLPQLHGIRRLTSEPADEFFHRAALHAGGQLGAYHVANHLLQLSQSRQRRPQRPWWSDAEPADDGYGRDFCLSREEELVQAPARAQLVDVQAPAQGRRRVHHGHHATAPRRH